MEGHLLCAEHPLVAVRRVPCSAQNSHLGTGGSDFPPRNQKVSQPTGDIIDRVVVDTTEYDDTTDTDIGNDWKEEDEESAG